jgi:hypothetical protein
VFQWQRIPFNADGEVADDFKLPPDWTIEILSPEQRPNKESVIFSTVCNTDADWVGLLTPMTPASWYFRLVSNLNFCKGAIA